jgi:formate dehydrogenase major subunit
MITITINGKRIETEPGKTILAVAEEQGISIPTLCHDEELKPFGSCWVCAVEVKGRRGFVTACGTEIADGMEVITNSPEVLSARKMALELLLSDHYADCEAPCKVACPSNVDVQTYVSHIANGNFHEAVKVIKETLPMPLSIGRVCPAFCEAECRRTIVDEPIAIRQLKRHAADFDLEDEWSWVPPKAPATGKKIAIIGGGPSGLTCGYYLSNNGHDVTVFESAPKAGGWLRYGIPEYRLPKATLDREIELMCANGMKIHTNTAVGSEITLTQLNAEYDAVYMAIGAQKAVPMRVKNSDMKGCYLGVDFLREHALGNKPKVGKTVAVIGGGNTAIDCARTAKRLGADVTLVYRRTRKEMPAEAYEVDAAEEEGISMLFLTNPAEFIGQRKKLKSIKLEKMELGEPDASGRRRPQPTGEFFEQEFDTAIAAISQQPDVEFLTEDANKPGGKEFPITRWFTLESDAETMFTGVDKFFAGGDFRRGPATAVEAIADGRKAAEAIHRYLNGQMMADPLKLFDSKKAKKLADVSAAEYEQYDEIPRYKTPELDAAERATTFEEVETGFTDEDAIGEAERCLECGCMVNTTCKLREYATEYQIDADLFMGEKNQHPIDESHPFILRDANKCIKCGRCVRICTEVQGPGVLGYIFRGFKAMVGPEFGEPLTETTCESCGKCIDVCPVGALLPQTIFYKQNPHPGEIVEQNCGLCGTGCKVAVHVQANTVTSVTYPQQQDFNGRNLCFDGKFGWQIFQSPQHLETPYIANEETSLEKIERTLHPCEEYDKLYALAQDKMNEAKSRNIYVSPACTNEEILLMKQVAKNIGASISSLSFDTSFVDDIAKTNLMNTTYLDLQHAETIVIVGRVSQTMRTMCRALQRKGAKLILINKEQSEFNRFADDYYHEPPEEVLRRVIADYCEEEEENEDERVEPITMDLPPKTVFLYSRDRVNEEIIWEVWMLASIICDFSQGSGVLPLSHYANFRGLQQLGIKAGKPRAADFTLLYGELPCEEQKKHVKNSKFTVSYLTHLDESDPAQIIFPRPSYLEIEGTALANDGRISRFHNPMHSNSFTQVLCSLQKMGMLSQEQTDPAYWQAAAETALSQEQPRKTMNDEQLRELLYNIEKVHFDKPKQHNIQKIMTAKLKKLTRITPVKEED